MSARGRHQHPPRPRGRASGDANAGPLTQVMAQARLAAFLGEPSGEAHDGLQMSEGLQGLVRQAAEVYASAISEATRADYVRRWRRFEQWCTDHEATSLPADPAVAMAFLADQAAGRAKSLATLRGLLAAINRVHLEAGVPPPSDDPAMMLFVRGLSRTLPARTPGDPISALRIADLRAVCRTMQQGQVDPRAVRDRALLALFGRGLAPETLAHLRWRDLDLTEDRVRLRRRQMDGRPVTIRKVATDAEESATARAVAAWRDLAGAGTPTGLVFIRIDGAGAVRQAPLHASEVRRVIVTRLDSLGGGATIPPARAVELLDGPPTADLRDRALLLLGFAGAFRRTELTALRWADLRGTPDGLVVHVRRSKTDQIGHGKDVGIPYGRSQLTCPVQAVYAWRDRVSAQMGAAFHEEMPCFVPVGRAGRLGTSALTPEGITRMIRRRAMRADLTGRWGGRSLRAGFISTAADLDIPLELIARQSRHATLNNLILYIRHDDPFRRNATARLGM